MKKGLRRFIGPKRLILFLIFLGLLYSIRNSNQGNMFSPEFVLDFRENNPNSAMIIFLLVYIISVVGALPTLPLNLAAGFFYGGVIGGVVSAGCATLGGLVSFLACRGIFGQIFLSRVKGKWMMRVLNEFELHDWKFVAFARVNPIFPTGPLNYFLGLTSLSTWKFIWVSFIFFLPPSLSIAFIGDVLGTFSTANSDVKSIMQSALIFSAAVTALVLIKYISTLSYGEEVKDDDNPSSNDVE